jgi:hypothetical protein
MRKLKSCVTGLLLGAGGMYAGLQYHLLLASEGFLVVPRAPQHRLQDVFADIQDWDADTWAARPQVARAVTEHGRADLIEPQRLPGLLDKLRTFAAPDHQVLPEATGSPQHEKSTRVPAPIANGKIAETDESTAESAVDQPTFVRSVLPLAELFGLSLSEGNQDRTPSGADEPHTETLVMPTGTERSLEVEFLPPPDAVDLGQPEPFPGSSPLQWRQTDSHSEYGQPGQPRRQAVKLIGPITQAPA